MINFRNIPISPPLGLFKLFKLEKIRANIKRVTSTVLGICDHAFQTWAEIVVIIYNGVPI